MRERYHLQALITAHIQGPGNHPVLVHRGYELLVGTKLLVLTRQLSLVHIQKLSPQKANSLGPIVLSILDVRKRTNVGRNLKVTTILADGFLVPQRTPGLLLSGKPAGKEAVLFKLAFRRINDHLAVNTVNHQEVSILNRRRGLLRSDNHRQGKGLTHDCEMGGPPPGIRDQARDVAPVKLGRIRWGDVISHDNCPVVELLGIREFNAKEVAQQALG